MEPDARGARRGAGGGTRADGATAPLSLADTRGNRDDPRRQRAREPPARTRRSLRGRAWVDRLQRRHRAGGGDERRRLLPPGDGRADPQVRGDGRMVRRRWADGLVQRPDPVRRAGGAGGADGGRDARRDGRPDGEVAETWARARLLARRG